MVETHSLPGTVLTRDSAFAFAFNRLLIAHSRLPVFFYKLGEEVEMKGLPPIVTLSSETSVTATYDNHSVTSVNDHVVRISTMTQPYPWHCHPNSDETFLVLEGGIAIEFEQGEIQLAPGQMATVSRGVYHRTRPLGQRSVNLTFEAAGTTTELSQSAKDR